MGQNLVEIRPHELQFTFEVKKQSSCVVRLINYSNEYVAFKVKATAPLRYCVYPNTGVILPWKTCEFTVTMDGLLGAPPGMQLRDKFLVQTVVVPRGTSDKELVPAFFSKEGRYIEESKLSVVLVRAHQSLKEHNASHDKKEDVAPTPLVQAPATVTEVADLKSKVNTLESKLDAAEKMTKRLQLGMFLSFGLALLCILRKPA